MNLGPLRINASKSGLGYSFGGRGFRIGRDAKGRKYTSVSVPGTGLYNRSYSKTSRPAPPPRYTSASSTANPATGKRLISLASYFAGATLLYLLISWFAHLL